jgi:hypothetical protein
MTFTTQNVHSAEDGFALSGQIACVWRGRVRDLVPLLGQPSFFTGCVQRYEAAGFGSVSDAERRTWHRSWPPLVDALMRAGSG